MENKIYTIKDLDEKDVGSIITIENKDYLYLQAIPLLLEEKILHEFIEIKTEKKFEYLVYMNCPQKTLISSKNLKEVKNVFF